MVKPIKHFKKKQHKKVKLFQKIERDHLPAFLLSQNNTCAELYLVAQHVWLFETAWTIALQAPLPMGILQERVLEWVAMPSSRGYSQASDQTQVSCITGRFFTFWTTREAQEYWSGRSIPSSEDLLDPGIEPQSHALQLDY